MDTWKSVAVVSTRFRRSRQTLETQLRAADQVSQTCTTVHDTCAVWWGVNAVSTGNNRRTHDITTSPPVRKFSQGSVTHTLGGLPVQEAYVERTLL